MLRNSHGQGATEYLVLLAVVLIIALVSISLLGFYPGMAADAQINENQIYWKSARPIAIVESGAYYLTAGSGGSVAYLRLRNVGASPIRITKVIGSGGYASFYYNVGMNNISDSYHLAPGEEKYFGTSIMGGSTRYMYFWKSYASGDMVVSGATSECAVSGPMGTLIVPGFGFEYIAYVDNQQITKTQIGSKPLMIKCDASSPIY